MRALTTIIMLCLFLFVNGCGYYSFSSSLPGHIKTAAVPLFENQTVEPGLVENVTDVIEGAILRDGNMKIASESQADAVVQGTIIDVIDEADSFSRDEEADQFKIRILADVQFYDRVKNKAVWEEARMEGWAQYQEGGDVSRDDAIQTAIEMLAEKIIDKTVAGW